MAIGFISKLEQCGYKVPEDMRVTGFDNTLRAQSNIPGLASVKRCDEELGRQCVDRMIGLLAGGIYPKMSTAHMNICQMRAAAVYHME